MYCDSQDNPLWKISHDDDTGKNLESAKRHSATSQFSKIDKQGKGENMKFGVLLSTAIWIWTKKPSFVE